MAAQPLPYRIAVLCELRDAQGRHLLIHRRRPPNQHLYSPIGGKLDVETGESPTQCARREIMEEAGIEVPIERLRLKGMISETAFEGAGHWLIFWYRVEGAVEVAEQDIPEGRLEWRSPDEIGSLPVPDTDRRILWPLVIEHENGFFAVHVDCSGADLRWTVEQSTLRRA